MLEFFKKNTPTQLNNETPDTANKELSRLRKRIGLQAYLAVMTVVLAVVLVFGMTAAWYTNVVQSGGLIFEVEQSGVNVDATVKATTFTAKPGDQGVISLEAVNNGKKPVDITVSINKANMDVQMQKRLYFYVEAQETANGETGQRSYVTAMDGYTYRVFGGNNLALTEQYHNAAPLKWCWVYDVLGYYVLGQAQNGDVLVQEYLRPIEYDYDLATFDQDGNLLTVDGVTTADSFLTALAQTDGYPGQISAENMVGRYYQVAVDASGYGVFAYLCTYQEVEDHTDYDTALGAAALEGNPATYSALMTVNAEPSVFHTVTVGSVAALRSALEREDVDAIILGGNVMLSSDETLTIPAGKDLLLDLNGYSLTTNTSGYAFNLEPTASLTVSNGFLSGGSAGDAFKLVGADLTLNDVKLNNYNKAIHVMDYSGTGQDSTVRISGCEFDTKSYGVLLYGNGFGSEQTTKLLIEDSKLICDDYVIAGNGSIYGDGRWGTEIEVINSTLTQDVNSGVVSAAIYHPQRFSTVNIYGSTVSGYTGMAIKGGSVTIEESNVIGTGTSSAVPKLMTSGFSDTADAIYVETGYGYDISMRIRNSTANSFYGMGLRVYEENSPYVALTLEGKNYFNDNTKG